MTGASGPYFAEPEFHCNNHCRDRGFCFEPLTIPKKKKKASTSVVSMGMRVDANLSQKPKGFCTHSTVMLPPQTTPRTENNSASARGTRVYFAFSGVSPIPKMMAKVFNQRRVSHVNLTNLGLSPLKCYTKYSRIHARIHCQKQTLAIQVPCKTYYSWEKRSTAQA